MEDRRKAVDEGTRRVSAACGGARALVTGAAGFLGSSVCRALIAADVRVLGVDSFITGRRENVADLVDDPRFELAEADVVEYLDVPRDLDLVLHLASPASPVDYLRHPIHTMKVGSIGTLNALGVARDRGARFLLASTSEVYGDPREHPQSEAYRGNVDTTGPRGVYDEAKRFAEAMTYAYHRDHGVDVRVARIFNTYGPGMRPDDGRLVPTLVGQALRGEPLTVHGTGDQTRSLCHVDDMVDGLLRLLVADRTLPCNLGSDVEVRVIEIARAILRHCGTDGQIVHTERASHDPQRRRPDLSVARRELGWEPTVGLDEGLADTVRWAMSERDRFTS